MAISRTSFTVKANGQTLSVNISGVVTPTLYSDVALTSSLTLPYTISADQTFYLNDDYGASYVVSVKQPDGTELWGRSTQIRPGSPVTIDPVPSVEQVGADVGYGDYFRANQLATGQETVPRMLANQSATMTTQILRLSFFTARASMTVGSVRVFTTATAAGATPSVIRFGLYSVDTTDDSLVSLLASTANDTALLASQNTAYTKALSANYTISGGTRYCFASLVVTAATAPTIACALSMGQTEAALPPRLGGYVAAQSDLPAGPVAAGSITANNAHVYGVLVPA